jgi:hypothetical protein
MTSRLRFSIDIVGDHSMNDLALQRAMKQIAREYVEPTTRLELLPTHDHVVGCEFCMHSIEEPDYQALPF